MSSAEAFGRVHRLLTAKGVILIFCGISPESPVAQALQSVDLWTDQGLGVEVFEDLNNALEC
jgi:SulP family sulfate permease